MGTVFSYVVQKRFSQVNEDIASDALAFILHSNESARTSMMKLLRGIVLDMPSLQFRTQKAKGQIRPDLAGYDETELRVYIENKFWAGLTDNQPVSYIKELAEHTQPTVLLMVVPAEREQPLWREVSRRPKKGRDYSGRSRCCPRDCLFRQDGELPDTRAHVMDEVAFGPGA